jgi:hypothetical protein
MSTNPKIEYGVRNAECGMRNPEHFAPLNVYSSRSHQDVFHWTGEVMALEGTPGHQIRIAIRIQIRSHCEVDFAGAAMTEFMRQLRVERPKFGISSFSDLIWCLNSTFPLLMP